MYESMDDFFEKRGFLISSVGSDSEEVNGRSNTEVWSFLKSE
jgi:hypothetical protein